MCGQNKIAALILAAGYSTRMGDFKPLMELNGYTVLERSIKSFQNAGIPDIMVVIGHRASEIIPLMEKLDVSYVINDNYQDGMFSSVTAGLGSIANQISGFFLLPGDMPLVKPLTIEKILDESAITDAGIIYPCFMGKRGHPPYISSKYFTEILSSDVSDNLRSVLSRFENDSREVELIDQAILMDLDTPEDFQQTVSYLNRRNIPTKDECAAIFLKYKTPAQVIEHGKAVSEISGRIVNLLNDTCRYSLDADLIKTGALLHDVVKDRPKHADEGAAVLEYLGYHEIAGIIASHMDIEFEEKNHNIDGAAIVYLADKLTKDDRLISLEERFAESSGQFSMKPEILTNIRKRKNNALLIKEQIENAIGVNDLESILGKTAAGV